MEPASEAAYSWEPHVRATGWTERHDDEQPDLIDMLNDYYNTPAD